MPLDTCITNVGEYYSSHYLDSTFAKDVKELLAKWNEQGSQAPPRRLQSLSQHYFRAKSLALDEVDPARRREAGDEVHGWHAHLIQTLGYHDLTPFDHAVEGGNSFVPTLGRVNRYNKPWLVVCESHFCLPDGSLKEGQPSEDPLSMEPNVGQLANSTEHPLCAGDWTRCVGRVFTEEDAPRWILLLAGSQVLLLDRNTFAQGRFLAFDLDDAFGRKERDTFNHLAAFLAAETLCPGGESDEVLHDKLEEQNHRFAHGVTENLQYAVREAIELLANEWVEDRRAKGWSYMRLRAEEAEIGVTHGFLQGEDGSFEVTAEHLKHEALTFVYRLLFCFYAEARGGELEILPMDEDAYRLGYRTKIPLSRAGIDVRGRSRRLKINYRTSEQIRQFAQGILKGMEIDDLDGGVITTVGDHSVFKGPPPVVEKCPSEKAEADAIVAWVQMIMSDYGLATHEICVTPRKPKIVTALTAAGIATFELKPREEDPGPAESGVRMGTMKRIKGLEFRAVAMACAADADPMNNLDEADVRDRCERYVAATRAREYLLVVAHDSK